MQLLVGRQGAGQGKGKEQEGKRRVKERGKVRALCHLIHSQNRDLD